MKWSLGLAGGEASPQQPRHSLGQDSPCLPVVWWSLACQAVLPLAFRILAHQPLLAALLLHTVHLGVPCYWKEPLEPELMCWNFFRAPLSLYES